MRGGGGYITWKGNPHSDTPAAIGIRLPRIPLFALPLTYEVTHPFVRSALPLRLLLRCPPRIFILMESSSAALRPRSA